jgi:hypothetical protein
MAVRLLTLLTIALLFSLANIGANAELKRRVIYVTNWAQVSTVERDAGGRGGLMKGS